MEKCVAQFYIYQNSQHQEFSVPPEQVGIYFRRSLADSNSVVASHHLLVS